MCLVHKYKKNEKRSVYTEKTKKKKTNHPDAAYTQEKLMTHHSIA